MLSRWCIALLLLLSAVQQARLIARAPLPAQDAVEFVAVAQQIERDGLPATVREQPVAPLFPLVLALTHRILVATGLFAPDDWARAAQIAAAWPMALAVIPIAFTTARLFGRDAAILAGTLFCLLPAVARGGADGISDGLHLLLAASSVWALVVARERFSGNAATLIPWLGAGALCGAALLCRAEALVIGATIGAWTLFSLRSRRRCTTSFALGSLVCVVTYAACGAVEPATIAQRIRGGGTALDTIPLNDTPLNHAVLQSTAEAGLRAADGAPHTFGRKDRSRSMRLHGFFAVACEFVEQGMQAGGYFVGPLALVGAWSLGRRPKHPALALTWSIALVHLVVSFTFAERQGYITARHFLLPVAVLLPTAALGTLALGSWISQLRFVPFTSATASRLATTSLCMASLAVSSRPLHATHEAHRRAADWLRSAEADAGAVLDQQGWTALYTGRPTYRFEAAEAALVDPRLTYVVVERADLEAESRRGESLRAILGDAADATRSFASASGRPEQDVLLFHRTPEVARELRSAARSQPDRLTVQR